MVESTIRGASPLTIPGQSSLTIIQDKLNIGSDAQVYTSSNGMTAQRKSLFSICTVKQCWLASAGGFKGSVLGNTVNISGADGIICDTALSQTTERDGSTSGPGSHLVFKGWRYANKVKMKVTKLLWSSNFQLSHFQFSFTTTQNRKYFSCVMYQVDNSVIDFNRNYIITANRC